ncbi:nonribosomal peptide synthetase 2 protein [Purpureocillium lavendulum]|uniref:Nonribosomal peptide synthetase 2 protein n=1 Tax=Purpureocillium lavendulum TaxID=1247861 RepID=A0AB34FJ76_9HYPO|nr:nonribosomal peptide synthetase 2 protein [Purpureocillium lavendulum]
MPRCKVQHAPPNTSSFLAVPRAIETTFMLFPKIIMTDSTGLSILNEKPKTLPGPQLLHQLVAPPCDSTAIEHLSHGQKTLFTYRHLHEAAECVARHVAEALGPIGNAAEELVVPLLIPQCPLLYISQLAVLKAGGAFCPLNLDAPLERIKFILKDVSSSVILATGDLASKIPAGAGVNVIRVDEIDIASTHGGIEEARKPQPDNLAYVMYTSGSTGTPKGVGISHSAATQALLAHDPHIPHFSRFLQFAAPTFDVSVFEIFFPLFRRSTLISPALSSSASTGNIGIPLETVSCFIVEPEATSQGDSFKILPVGEAGELVVGGHQLAKGYLNRPEQTASAFISTQYGRVYRTGDRARLTTDGTLECLGRLSSGQVKLRGQRIELGEVEQVVLKTPGCHSAVAAVVDSNLVVFCAVDEDVTEAAVVTNCEKWLPRFMVPSELLLFREFPRLPSGKIDTRKLVSDFSQQKAAAMHAVDAEDLSSHDEAVVRTVSEILGLSATMRMDLISAGLDSLRAISLASSLRAAGFETTATELLRQRKVADLCATIYQKTSDADRKQDASAFSILDDLDEILFANPALQAHEARVEDIVPCTSLQSAMLAETARHPLAYWNEISVQVTSGTTAVDLLAAVTQVANANEILRTGFVQWSGRYVSIVFNKFPADKACIVSSFEANSCFETPEDLLAPFRVQIESSEDGMAQGMLIHAHHAIYDGWSMDTIFADTTALLRRSPLASRPHFRDVARYYAGAHSKSANDAARSFWSESLLGWNKTPFPKLAARPSTKEEIKTTAKDIDLSPDTARKASQEIGISPQVWFQGALALVWSGIVGEPDVMMGAVTSGRTIPVLGIEHVLGPCLAALPLRISLGGIATKLDLLRSMHARNRAVMEHCTLPLSDIKKLAGLNPAESLYDVLFVYQESPQTKHYNDLLVKQRSHVDRLETKLLIEVEPRGDNFALQATFHTSSVPSDFANYLLGELCSIVNSLFNDVHGAIDNLDRGLTDTLSVYNPRVQSWEGIPDLATQFERVAATSPSAQALCFRSSWDDSLLEMMSYHDLNVMANQIARLLRSSGAQTGQVVAIVMDKSLSLYASILAIIKAGYAYLPILPTTPVARIRDIFWQARITLCLTEDSSLQLLAPIDGVRFLSTGDTRWESFSGENLAIPPDPSRLAYVIYTSGTTGVPKGVAVTQKNIVSNIAHLRSIYPASSGSQPRFLQACSQAFDVSVFEIFFAWHAGMCLCSATNDVLFEDLEKSIRELHITHLSLTPTVAALIDPANVPKVAFLVTAGEPMTQFVLDQWDSKLWQGYGPSETTNICSVKRMARGEHIEHLGWVFPNTSVFVMPPKGLNPVPIGWVGEFCFGGDQVAHGYLNDPKLTAEKFITHAEHGRIYRSGDLGRMLPDGSLVILGRLDDQLKLRGQRIEAGEVNSVVTSTKLAEAAVTMSIRRGQAVPEQLACFYVALKSNADFRAVNVSLETNRHLFSTLRSKVPAYMVPSYLIPVSQVPLTSSGKVDKRRLQTCFDGLSQQYLENASLSVQKPADDDDWSSTESSIAAVISKSRQVPRDEIGRWTPFPALGVDSITAIDLARALSAQLDQRVAISTILQNPSVAQLARSLDGRGKDDGGRAWSKTDSIFAQIANDVQTSVIPDPSNIEATLPCTPLQEAMLSQGQGSYCNKILLRLRIPAGDMRTYWEAMSQRHGILRTCFVTTKNASFPIAQVILRRREIDWKTYDVLAPSLAGAAHAHLKTLPEPLDSGLPPVSFALIRYKGSTFLSLICHHALYDGVAMENLWREVECLAQGGTLPPPVAYKPFLQHALALPNSVDEFWSNHLRGFKPSTLFQRHAGADINQATHSTSLDMPFGDAQQRLKAIGSSLLSVCQAAWANVLSIACDYPDIAFGNVVSGRTLDLDGLERLVAPCFNTVPMRKDMSTSAQNMDTVRYFQSLNTQMIRYQFTSLRRVQKVANCQRRGLFDTLLLLQQSLRDMDERVWTLEEDSGDMDVPLVCEVVPCPNLNSVVANVHYDMGVVSGDAATAMADLFKLIFRRILELPNASPLNRSALPRNMALGLRDLVSKRDKSEERAQPKADEGPWTYTEKVIRMIISELSNVPAVNVARSTSIFQLGLDSINAVQVASMLRQSGYKVSASDVIECSTCEKLARRISHTSTQNIEAMKPTFALQEFASDVEAHVRDKHPDMGPSEALLPCTPVQSAMLASFVQTEGQAYLNVLTYEVDQSIGLERLVASWRTVEEHHPMLRTGFLPVNHKDSSYAMIIYPPNTIESKVERAMEGFDRNDWQTLSRSAILSNLHRPPWRIALERTATRVTMHIVVHHALYDARSLDEMLSAVSISLDGHERAFAKVEPALGELLVRSLRDQGAAERFWSSLSTATVVNKFPLMTPLREADSGLLVHRLESAMRFADLRKGTQALGVSIQAAIQASWTRVLATYLGESSVVFGVTMSGRTTDSMQDAPFPCITTVPVIASNHKSNHDLMRSMMQYNVELHQHQYAPLSHIQRWLGRPGSPLFDTLVVYQKREETGSSARPWTLVRDDAVVEYAVSLEVEPAEDGGAVRLCLTFAPSILPTQQAHTLLQQFDATLDDLVRNPGGSEDDLYKRHPNLFAVTPAEIPHIAAPVAFLHQFVERGASLHPSRTALEFVRSLDGNSISRTAWRYDEFNCIGNRMANLLRERSQLGDTVAIYFPKCPEAYFSILGILKAGCSFVALDPNAPKARKEFILRDSQATCLLTDKNTVVDFDVSTTLFRVDEDSLLEYSDKPPQLGDDFTPGHTCYCLYTSGTTGTPKGCEITHENAVQAMMAFQHLFAGHWEDDSRWLQFAALHFDVSVLEQYWSWSTGITVVAAPRDLILDDLTGTINKLGITHIDLTPSLARLTHPDEVPSLCKGVFITGGESLKQEILDAWGSKAVIYNAYGPTEATIGVTTYPRVPVNGRPSNIGRQFLNVGSYVFHPGTEIPVLRGGVGELCVSGKLVGKGYLHRPDLTAERFPTLSEFGERIYRTGDLVRILYDGCFDFLGRADDQVKLRGQRLEIGEINHAIRTGAPDVRDAATIVVRQETSGKDALVSFVVGEPNHTAKLGVLSDEGGLAVKARAACLERLPGYMVPTYFLRLPYIPLSPNNKVEAKELKILFGRLSHEELMQFSTAAMPSSDTGLDQAALEKVSEILAEFTHIARNTVSASTSIFDLGVDSINVLQLSAQLKSRGFPAASPVTLLRNSIMADLVRAISSKETAGRKTDAVRESKQAIQACNHRYRPLVCRELSVTADDIEYIAPCSPLQQGIVSKALTDGTGCAYFNTFVFKINDTATTERIRVAWERLIDSHAILRTVFVETPDGHVQVALKRSNMTWETCTLQSQEELGSAIQASRHAWISRNGHHIHRPLQLTHVDTRGVHTVLLHILHALYDGNSFDLMNEYASDLYHNREVKSGPSFLDALAYGPLSKHDHSRDFWVEHLRGWSSAPIPMATTSSKEVRAVAATRTIPLINVEGLRASHNVTLQATVLALWTSVLQRYLGGKVTIGVIVSGRALDLEGVDRTVGPLFNTVPFFNKTLSKQTWPGLLNHVHDFSAAVLPFQHVPLKDVQKWCSGGQALFDNLFAFQIEQPTADKEDTPWAIVDSPSEPDYPLALEATRTRTGELRLVLVAQDHVADTALLESLLNEMESAAASAQRGGLVDSNAPAVPEEDATQSEEVADDAPGRNDEFQWTNTTRLIQREMASLADVTPEQIGPFTTMLEVGLDSIDVIKLSTRLKRIGIQLSASRIMRYQTIARLASELSPEMAGAKTPPNKNLQSMLPKLQAQVEQANIAMEGVESILPPTALQESMVAGMLESDFEWYYNHDVLEVAPGVDLARLQAAWEQVIAQSPILRTGFVEVDDPSLDMAFCQVVFRDEAARIVFKELSEVSELDLMMSDATSRAVEGRALTNLRQVAFAAVGERRFVVLSLAHALYDGWSLSLLYQDLQAAYEGRHMSRPSPDLFISKALASQGPQARNFWSTYLDGVAPTILQGQVDRATTPTRLHRAEAASRVAASDVTSFCKNNSLSLQVVCFACWAIVLAQRVRSLDVVFGLVLSGRDFDGAEELLFPTMNTVAVRCVLHGSVKSFLGYLEETMADIRDYQDFPLRKAQAGAKLAATEMFNSLFLLQKAPEQAGTTQRLLKSVDGASAVDYPVCVEAEQTEGQLIWRVASQGQFFSQADADGLIHELDRVLEFFCGSPAAELLAFHGSQVSLCGMEPVAVEDSSSGGPSDESGEADEHEHWESTATAIRQVLSQVAGIPESAIKPSSTLYRLGLDSISAIKVSLLLRREGINLRPRDLVTASSIRDLGVLATGAAETVSKEPQSAPTWVLPGGLGVNNLITESGIPDSDVEAVLPATPLQVYMLTAWSKSGGSIFCPEFCYRIQGPVDENQVRDAWDALVREAPILRTRLVATGSKDVPFLQVVASAESFRSARVTQPLVHLSVASGEDVEALTLRLTIHHALYDGVSLPALMARLAALLNGAAAQVPDTTGWTTFAVQPTVESSRTFRKEFWTAYLANAPPCGAGHATISKITERTAFLDESAIADISNLRLLASQNGISLQSLVLAAYARTIADPSATSVLFGVYLANRTGAADDPSELYPALNLVPLKVDVGVGKDLSAIARGIQDGIHAVSSHGRADVGLWEIYEWTGHTVDSFVNFLSLPDEDSTSPSSSSSSVGVTVVPVKDAGVTASRGFESSTLLDEPWLQRNAVADAYPVSVDVEASVQSQAVAIGVFGPAERVSSHAAAGMAAKMATLLGEAPDELIVALPTAGASSLRRNVLLLHLPGQQAHGPQRLLAADALHLGLARAQLRVLGDDAAARRVKVRARVAALKGPPLAGEGRQSDEATAEAQVRVPALSDALGMAGDGAVDGGVGLAQQLPVGGVEVGVPGRAVVAALPTAIVFVGGGRWGGARREKGPQEVVGGGEARRGHEAQGAWLDGGQGEQALEHAEDGAGAVAVVQVRRRRGALPGAGPGVVFLPPAGEDVVVGAAAAVAVGLPALERAVVDLGDDAGRRLQGVDPVVGRLRREELRLLLLLLLLLAVHGAGAGGRRRRRERRRAGAAGVRVEAAAVEADAVGVGDGQVRRDAVLGVGLPQAHHEALGAPDVGVRPRADLGGRPEAVEARRILPRRAKVAPVPSRCLCVCVCVCMACVRRRLLLLLAPLAATMTTMTATAATASDDKGAGRGGPAAGVEVADRVTDGVVSVAARQDLADDADAVAAQVAAEARRLGGVVEIGELDRGHEVGAEALDVLDLVSQGGEQARPRGLEVGLVAGDEVALDAGEARRQGHGSESGGLLSPVVGLVGLVPVVIAVVVVVVVVSVVASVVMLVLVLAPLPLLLLRPPVQALALALVSPPSTLADCCGGGDDDEGGDDAARRTPATATAPAAVGESAPATAATAAAQGRPVDGDAASQDAL